VTSLVAGRIVSASTYNSPRNGTGSCAGLRAFRTAPASSRSRLRRHPEALRRQLEFGTPRELWVGSRSATPRARVATRLSAMHVWSRSTTLLRHPRCVQESPQTAHAWQSQTDSDRDMDSVREQVIKRHRTTRVTSTHPDTEVHRKDSSGHLPPRARIRHHHEALPRREGKKGKDKGGLERTRTKHGLRRLYSRRAMRSTS
jgi:hypothetical protein